MVPQSGKEMSLERISQQLYHSCLPKTSQSSTWSHHPRNLLHLISETDKPERCLVHLHQPVEHIFQYSLFNHLHQTLLRRRSKQLTYLVEYREFGFEPCTSELLDLRIWSGFLTPKLIARKSKYLKSYNDVVQRLLEFSKWNPQNKFLLTIYFFRVF